MGTLANSKDPDNGSFAWINHVFFRFEMQFFKIVISDPLLCTMANAFIWYQTRWKKPSVYRGLNCFSFTRCDQNVISQICFGEIH